MSRPADSKVPAGRKPRPARRRHFLLESGYAKATVNKYRAAVSRFLQWCTAAQHTADTFEDLDDLLTDYFHDLYELNDGRGKQTARDTLYGVEMLMPRAKGKLLVAQRVANRWAKLKPAESYPPLTWELTVVVAIQMLRNGYHRYAVATLLAFDCLLRVGELCALRASDIADAGDARMGAQYRQTLVAIRQAKTGRNQSVAVTRDEVKALLRPILDDTKSGALLFPGGSAGYRRVFKSVCADLGLSAKYVPHSLRHGGATFLHLSGVPLESILIRGRWASHKSARTYIQSSRAMLMSMRAPRPIAEAAVILARDVPLSFALAQLH